MEVLYYIIIALYGGFMLFIFLYSLVQLNLVWNYLRVKSEKLKVDNKVDFLLSTFDFPTVTVQLPIFNERYVVNRLIDCICKFDYPEERLEIQVLDDSTDETVKIVAEKVKDAQEKGFDIKHIRRDDRKGFKAGALAEATQVAKGEFIAIFDADFLPRKDFLVKTISQFQDEKVGVVQTRWGHLNKGYSLLTSLQAFGLDAHFTIEQVGRNSGNHFINFNGTAGVWRKTCIENAGGWESDTLTEDLDLSYRAQLKGWKFKYLEDVESPAELPATMNALKTQQFRWTKGAAECTRKNLGRMLRSNNLKLSTKLHGIFHLMNSFLFICVLGLVLMGVPMLFIKQHFIEHANYFNLGGLFLLSLGVIGLMYWTSYKQNFKNKGIAFLFFIVKFPMFLSVSMGLSLHNAIAVMEGYMGKKSPFVRTPKFNITSSEGEWKNNLYLTNAITPLAIMEGFMIVYFLFGIYQSIQFEDYGLLPFFIMLTIGYGVVFYFSVYHSINLLRNKRQSIILDSLNPVTNN